MSSTLLWAAVSALAEEYKKREQAKEDNIRADAIVRRVGTAINNAKREILHYLDELEITHVNGGFKGIMYSWNEYSSRREDLAGIKERLAVVLGNITSTFDSGLSNELKINLFPSYLIVVGFRAVCLSEYKYKFATTLQERNTYTRVIRDMWKEALEYWKIVDQLIWDELWRRFSDPEISSIKGDDPSGENCDEGYYEVGYFLDGNWQVVNNVHAKWSRVHHGGSHDPYFTCNYDWPSSPSKDTVLDEARNKLREDITRTYEKENSSFIRSKGKIEAVKGI
jgi:hypothetical protein